MHIAAERGDVAVLAAAVERRGAGAIHEPRADGATPLHAAAHFGQLAAAEWLLENGVGAHSGTTQALAPLAAVSCIGNGCSLLF